MLHSVVGLQPFTDRFSTCYSLQSSRRATYNPGMSSPAHAWSVSSFATFLLLLCGLATAAESDERRYIEGLCDRQLFQLAELYCRDRLSDSSRDESWRAFYAKELSRTLVRHALATPLTNADPLWQEAVAVLEPFAVSPTASIGLLARTQAALAKLSQGEALSLLPGLTDADRNTALDLLRDAARRFDEIAQTAQAESRFARQASQLRVDELRSLANQVACRQAQAYRLAASLHPPQTPDRADALNRAVELLEPLAELPPDQPLAWESRLNLISSLRLARDREAVARKLHALQEARPPDDVQLRARAEAIMLALDTNELTAALKLARYRSADSHTVPELDDARLQAVLANWRAADQARNDSHRDELEQEAQMLAATIRQHYGGVWTARAQRQLAALVGKVSRVGDLSVLQQSAEALYQAGQIDEAIAGYDRAAEQAAAQGDRDSAFHFAFLAATLEHQRHQYQQASDRYRDLARKWPDAPRAAEAHLLAAHDAWLHSRSSGESESAPYQALLREHLRTWPNSESAHEARWRLGRAAEQQGNLSAALDAYRGVGLAHARGPDALTSLLRCYQLLLSQAPTASDGAPASVTEGARYVEALSSSDQLRSMPELRHQAALSAAQLWQSIPAHGSTAARRTLRAYLAMPDLTSEQRQEAESELALLDLGSADPASTDSPLAQIDRLTADQRYRSLQRLAQKMSAATPAEQVRLAELTMQIASSHGSPTDEQTEAQQRDCQLWQADALARLDRTAEALALYEQLQAQWPDDFQVARALARALASQHQPAQQQRALELWRKVEQSEPRDSDAWLESRLQIARLHRALGNADQARRILRMTRLLHPAHANRELHSQLLALEYELAQ